MANPTIDLITGLPSSNVQTVYPGDKPVGTSTSYTPNPSPTPSPSPSTSPTPTSSNQTSPSVVSQSTDASGNVTKYMSDGSRVTTNAQGQPISTPTTPTTTSPITPTSSVPPSTTPFTTAQSTLTPSTTSEADFFSRVQQEMGPAFDAINKAAIAEEQAAASGAALQSTRETSAMNVGMSQRGLTGSTEAASMVGNIEKERQASVDAAVAQAEKDRAQSIANLQSFTTQQSHSDFQQALARNDTLSQNYIADTKANTLKELQLYATKGGTPDDLKKTDPVTYNRILQIYGGNENTLKFDMMSAASGQAVGSPIYSGTHIIQTYRKPDGSTYVINSDTGTQLTADDIVSKSSDGAMFLVNKRDGTVKQLTSADPYYEANKASTLQSRQAMTVSRYGTAVNNLIKQIYPTPTSNPFNLYSNSLNYTAKLDTAYKMSSDPTNKNKGASDLELADAAIKINNGGQQITEAQFNAFNESLGKLGEAKLTWDKFKAAQTGGDLLLTKGQRDSIHKLAKENIDAQKENALAATKVIQERATRAGVPSQFITTPDDVIGLQSARETPGAQSPAIDEISSAGGTDNGDGTWTMPDGSVVDPNQ